MNDSEMSALDYEVTRINKGQAGVIATLLGVIAAVMTSLATAVYGYGSLSNQLTATMESLQEVRADLKGLQETKFITTEAIKQISELKQVIGRLETRVTYVERSGLEILTGVGSNGNGAGACKTQRAQRDPD